MSFYPNPEGPYNITAEIQFQKSQKDRWKNYDEWILCGYLIKITLWKFFVHVFLLRLIIDAIFLCSGHIILFLLYMMTLKNFGPCSP
jgi:hypothetical protein